MAVPKVLLVEPDDELRRLFRRRFGREGFDLLEAVDGEAALGAAHAGMPDVIVVESSVFDAAGMDLPGRLASEPALRRVPVIVLSSRDPWTSLEERVHGPKDAYRPALLPDTVGSAGNQLPPGYRHELRHPFRLGKLVELARGALDTEGGPGATGTSG